MQTVNKICEEEGRIHETKQRKEGNKERLPRHIFIQDFTGVEAMRRFIPAGFEASNGVLIALLGLC